MGIGSKIKSFFQGVGASIAKSQKVTPAQVQASTTKGGLSTPSASQASSIASSVNAGAGKNYAQSVINQSGSKTGTSSKGGGGGSSSSSTSTSTKTTSPSVQLTPTKTNELAKDVPSSYSTISTYKPPTLSDIPNFVKSNIKQKGLYETGKTALQMGYSATIGKVLSKKAEADKVRFEEQVASRGTTTTFIPSEADKYGGTGNIRVTEVPTEQLLRDASMGDAVALEVASRRAQQNIDIEVKTQSINLLNEDRKKLENYSNVVQGLLNNGGMSVEEANQKVQEYAVQLDTQRITAIQNNINPKIQNYQNTLDKAAKYGGLSRLALNTAISFAGGYLTGAGISNLPKNIQTGLAIAGGTAVAYQGTKLGMNVATGKAGLMEVASFGVPLIAFGAGASVYARTNKVNQGMFNTAMETARLEIKEPVKVLTTEVQIKALKLPPNQEAELIGQLNAGSRVAIQKYDIVASNSKLQKVINKAIPNRDIISYGQVDNVGNFIQGNSIVKIKVGKGFNNYIELQTGRSLGTYDAKTGQAVIETFNVRLPKKMKSAEDILGISKTKTIIPKPTQNLIKTSTGDIIGRRIKSESYLYEGASKVKTPESQITYKDWEAILKADKYKKYPSMKSSQTELQGIIGKQQLTAKIKASAGDIEKAIGINVNKIKLKTGRIKGVSERIPKPFEFERGATSKSMKPFKVEEVNPFKDFKFGKIGKGTKQLLKPTQRTEQIINNLPQFDVRTDILKGIEAGARQVSKTRKPVVSLDKLWTSGRNKELEKLYPKDINLINTLGLNKNLIKKKAGTFPVVVKKTGSKSATSLIQPQIQASQLNIKQLNKLIQTPKLKQPTITPNINIPTLKIRDMFIPPKLPSFNTGTGNKLYKKLTRKTSKWTPKYATNIASAAFQVKPFKVSPAQFKRLVSSKKYVTSLPLLEVDFGLDDKQVRKGLKKVSFGF